MSETPGNSLVPLEWFVKGVSEPLHFDLSESWELFEPSCRRIGDISETLARGHQHLAPGEMDVRIEKGDLTPIEERRVSTSVLLTLLMLVRADRKTEE